MERSYFLDTAFMTSGLIGTCVGPVSLKERKKMKCWFCKVRDATYKILFEGEGRLVCDRCFRNLGGGNVVIHYA